MKSVEGPKLTIKDGQDPAFPQSDQFARVPYFVGSQDQTVFVIPQGFIRKRTRSSLAAALDGGGRVGNLNSC